MDTSVSYMTVNMGRKDSRSPSPDEPDVSYAEVNFKPLSAPRVRTDRDGLNSTYSELNFRKEELRIDEREDPPLASGSSGLSATAHTAAQERESKVKNGNRPYRMICLLCLVTSALIVTVTGLSIHVSQIRHQVTEMETKYRSINETKAQICELLTSRRETTCPQEWIKNEDRCYFMSTFGTSYDGARHNCSELDTRLLEINSNKEKKFVSNAVDRYVTYWIGKCAGRNVASDLVYELSYETPTCSVGPCPDLIFLSYNTSCNEMDASQNMSPSRLNLFLPDIV
ncbi:C-type lectin domain family 4 member A-like [Hypanus sabinus]|uniref:C-type lectin domain family 4 member A-like n=1 Tax=Hypanus sabinus TaxID=79690 RepID=UPI0028C42199|nr:C-type lectin domain family 4 member A-like [Hypanus sabinus]